MADPKPDAVRCSLEHAGSGDAATRLSRLHSEFADILRVPRVFVRHQGGEHFISGDPNDLLNFAHDSSRAHEPRYEWKDRGDGVLYGFLKDDDRP